MEYAKVYSLGFVMPILISRCMFNCCSVINLLIFAWRSGKAGMEINRP